MTSFNAPPNFSHRMLMLTAGILLFAAADGALAKNGGHSNNHGDKHSERHDDKNRNGDKKSALREVRRDKDIGGDKHAATHKDKETKHAEKLKEKAEKRAERMKEKETKQADKSKDQSKTTGTTTTTAGGKTPAADGSLFDHGVVGKTSSDIKQIPIDPGMGGKTPTSATGGNVTVSNGRDSYEISNGPGGVAVYSGKAGTITVTNGKESKTLNGGSVTLSGNVIGVGAAQNVQVGARNGEGKTTIAIRPQEPEAKPPAAARPSNFSSSTGEKLGAVAVGALGTGAVTLVPPAAAGYGLAKDGVKGAYHATKDAVGAVGDAARDAAGLLGF
jgi:hypothetical protein